MLSLLLVFALQVPAAAAAPVAVPSRVVNVPRVVADSILGKAATAQMKTLQTERQKGIAEKQAALQKLMQSQAAPAQIDRAKVDLDRVTEDAKADAIALNKTLQADFDRRLRPILSQIAAEEHVDLVLDFPQNLLIWASPSTDITAKVIERLDAASKTP
jgi:Skp family chaperone for outer membrane proteins